jgi:dTDP-4-dehydrorhamnose reductase
MMQRRTLVLGGSGMLGHKLFQVLGQRHVVAATVRDPSAWSRHPLFGDRNRAIGGVEATVPETVAAAIDTVRPEVVVNCIGIVKQREAAADAARTHRVNSLFPHLLARLCGDRGCRLIHLSTDCVFSGRRGSYLEDDEPDPVDLYGRTKLLGEVTGQCCLTLRTSMIGRELVGRAGLLEWFISRRGAHVNGFRNAVFSGLTTSALARVIAAVVSDHSDLEGLLHVASEPISKHDLLLRMNRALNLGISVNPVAEPVCDRSLDGSRFAAATGIAVPSWDSMMEGLATDPTPYDEWRRAHEIT